jgi:hypothetical protein
MLTHTSAAVLVTALLPAIVRPPAPDPELVHAEKVLREKGITPDGATLLRFFRARSLSEADRPRLAEKVEQLGAEDFAVREQACSDLIAAGRLAVPFLQAAAADSDLERSLRARRCLAAIESKADLPVIIAAARLLADRRPEGAAETLLAYLPGADEVFVEPAVRDALLTVGLRDGTPLPAVLLALADAEPRRRAAAAQVIGRAKPGEQRPLRPLLGDADVRVRFEAAAALLRGGDRDGLPVLVALLEEAPATLAWQAHDLLLRVAGDRAPVAPGGTSDTARRCRRASWQEWAKQHGDKVDLTKVNFDEPLRLDVLCEVSPNAYESRIRAQRTDGTLLREVKDLNFMCDVQLLPNGRLLVAGTRYVTERDGDGNVLWQYWAPDVLTTCRRLPNGNTFIATYTEILEVSPGGKVVRSAKNPLGTTIFRAVRLRNGNVLFVCQGAVAEIDPDGKLVRRIDLPYQETRWGSVEPLPSGDYLVALFQCDRVLKVDAAGKVRWEANVHTPSSVQRLPNGNVLVGSMNDMRILELNPSGRHVWSMPTSGQVFRACRY